MTERQKIYIIAAVMGVIAIILVCVGLTVRFS